MATSTIERISDNPRKTLLCVALFLMVAGFVGGGVVGALNSQGFNVPNAESTRAIERIEAATGTSPDAGIVILTELPSGMSAGSGRLAQISRTLRDIPGIESVSTPIPSTNGHQALVIGTLDAKASTKEVAKTTTRAFAGQSDVTLGGPAIMNVQLSEQVGKDLGRAELIAMPILTVLALLIFGLRGAILPVLVGASTVLTTFLVIRGINQFYGMSVFALNLIMGLGLGLAIDYTLFLLTRYREELAEGATVHDATRTASGVLRGDRCGSTDHVDGLPARICGVDGHRGGSGGDCCRDLVPGHHAGDLRARWPQARLSVPAPSARDVTRRTARHWSVVPPVTRCDAASSHRGCADRSGHARGGRARFARGLDAH